MAHIPVSMKVVLDVYLRKRKVLYSILLHFSFIVAKKDADVSCVGAGNILGVQRIFCPYFPKFVRKNFMRQTFSL